MLEQLAALRRQQAREQIRQAEADARDLDAVPLDECEHIAALGADPRRDAYEARKRAGELRVLLRRLGG